MAENVPPKYRPRKRTFPSMVMTEGAMKKKVNPFKKMWSKSLCEKHDVSNVHLSSIQYSVVQLIAVEYTDILPLAILCGLTVKFSYSHTISSGFCLID